MILLAILALMALALALAVFTIFCNLTGRLFACILSPMWRKQP